MQPATKPVVPVILARSSEHVHPDVVLAQNKKVDDRNRIPKSEAEVVSHSYSFPHHYMPYRLSVGAGLLINLFDWGIGNKHT